MVNITDEQPKPESDNFDYWRCGHIHSTDTEIYFKDGNKKRVILSTRAYDQNNPTDGQKGVNMDVNDMARMEGYLFKLKLLYAEIIDTMNDFKSGYIPPMKYINIKDPLTGEKLTPYIGRSDEEIFLSESAINAAREGLKWAVKAVTWKD